MDVFPVMICKEFRCKSVVVDAFLALITCIFRGSNVINDVRLFTLLSPFPDVASPILLLSLVLRQAFFLYFFFNQLIELTLCRFSDYN